MTEQNRTRTIRVTIPDKASYSNHKVYRKSPTCTPRNVLESRLECLYNLTSLGKRVRQITVQDLIFT
jgi:hypothetical protein